MNEKIMIFFEFLLEIVENQQIEEKVEKQEEQEPEKKEENSKNSFLFRKTQFLSLIFDFYQKNQIFLFLSRKIKYNLIFPKNVKKFIFYLKSLIFFNNSYFL